MFKRVVNAVEVLALVAAAGALVLLVAYRPSPPPPASAAAAAAEVSGEAIYRTNCARCHGSTGEGGVAPKLGDGAVVTRFADPADQVAVVANGRGGMPAWAGRLTDDQIDAVVRYTRDDL